MTPPLDPLLEVGGGLGSICATQYRANENDTANLEFLKRKRCTRGQRHIIFSLTILSINLYVSERTIRSVVEEWGRRSLPQRTQFAQGFFFFLSFLFEFYGHHKGRLIFFFGCIFIFGGFERKCHIEIEGNAKKANQMTWRTNVF